MMFLFKIWCKFLKWFGDLYCAFTPPAVKAIDIRIALAELKPGDVIMRMYNYYLDGYFITKKKYSHSGVVIDKDTTIHSVAEGVRKIDVIDFIKDSDGFCILRPNYEDAVKAVTHGATDAAIASLIEGSILAVVNRALQLERDKTEYDFAYKLTNKAVYCHEMTAMVLAAGGIFIDPKLRSVLPFVKRKVYIDEDFLDVCSVVYVSNGVRCTSFMNRLIYKSIIKGLKGLKGYGAPIKI